MIRRLLIATASAILLTAGFSMQSHAYEATPSDVVNLARNGYFKDKGIPSHAGLISAYRLNNVTAEDLVNAAIAQNRLPSSTLEDEQFLHAVDQYLLDYSDRD